MLPAELVEKYKKLPADGAKKTSEPTKQYNCIAWSAERDQARWWQPIIEEPWDYWPSDIPDDLSFESFVLLFEKLGYQKCEDARFEVFYKKVALYAKEDVFSHVCDELNSGAWTSKLGHDGDIQHNTLQALEGTDGQEYGRVQQILKKRCGLQDGVCRLCFKVISFFRDFI